MRKLKQNEKIKKNSGCPLTRRETVPGNGASFFITNRILRYWTSARRRCTSTSLMLKASCTTIVNGTITLCHYSLPLIFTTTLHYCSSLLLFITALYHYSLLRFFPTGLYHDDECTSALCADVLLFTTALYHYSLLLLFTTVLSHCSLPRRRVHVGAVRRCGRPHVQ